MRYFMWNFVGRQNDLQGMTGDPWEGNWISGINFIDNMILGPQGNLPDSFKVNKARNTFFFLPFILGILGMVIHYRKRQFDANVVLTLFIFTGLAIIVYLNQPPFEPRERDYSMVGSFQTFCIWIGLGVLFLYDYLGKKLKISKTAIIAIVIGGSLLASPYLMAKYNWDDHDRSNRELGLSFAKNYLNSCEKNAILFTNGDNDTYPLWYAQNVEGIRTDIRIINLSLLGTDWYINALRRKVYDSEPLPISIPAEKLIEGQREATSFFDNGKFNQNSFFALDEVISFMTSDEEADKTADGNGQLVNYMPVKKFTLPVDREACIKSGMVKASDSIVSSINFDIGASNVYKGTLVVLDIIAQNAKTGWKRPIYFTTTTGESVYMNMDEYLRLEGLTKRLVPLKNDKNRQGLIDPDLMYNRLMNVFDWGKMDVNTNMNLDDKAVLVPRVCRQYFAQVAYEYTQRGDNTKAVALLDRSVKVIPETVLPMDFRFRFYYIDIYYAAKANKKAEAQLELLVKDCEQQTKFYKQYTGGKAKFVTEKLQESIGYINECAKKATENGNKALGDKYAALFNQLSRQ